VIAGLLTLGSAERWVRRGPMRLRAFRDLDSRSAGLLPFGPRTAGFPPSRGLTVARGIGQGPGVTSQPDMQGGQVGDGLQLTTRSLSFYTRHKAKQFVRQGTPTAPHGASLVNSRPPPLSGASRGAHHTTISAQRVIGTSHTRSAAKTALRLAALGVPLHSI